MNKRFVIGALLENKEGHKAFLAYSYAAAFGGKESNNIAVMWLDSKNNITGTSAWYRKSDFTVIDSDINENMKKICKYNSTHGGAPICMKVEMARKLGYKSIHTYESARKMMKHGSIKI